LKFNRQGCPYIIKKELKMSTKKRLTLHRHSDKTPDGKHISHAGKLLAMATGAIYKDQVHHVFFGPLIRTTESLCYLTAGNPEVFSDVTIFPSPIIGLGDEALFTQIATSKFKNLVSTEGLSFLEATLQAHDNETVEEFGQKSILAIRDMFQTMKDRQIGVGVFHDPIIALAAHFLGFENARSLESMESITFEQDEDGSITVVGINPAGMVI